MILVVNGQGEYWNGFSWSSQGKEFFSELAALRSLYEEGQDADFVEFVQTRKSKK